VSCRAEAERSLGGLGVRAGGLPNCKHAMREDLEGGRGGRNIRATVKKKKGMPNTAGAVDIRGKSKLRRDREERGGRNYFSGAVENDEQQMLPFSLLLLVPPPPTLHPKCKS